MRLKSNMRYNLTLAMTSTFALHEGTLSLGAYATVINQSRVIRFSDEGRSEASKATDFLHA